ncbi:hypothetical protein ASF36_23375 [Methylobacterium sp. Leaf90]|nr:hypothetical protein ASF36_23375 [Methylobacterium sp. Leaf90]
MSDAVQIAAVYSVAGVIIAIIALSIFRSPFTRAIDRWKGATLGNDRSLDLSGTAAAQVEAQKHAPVPEPEKLPIPTPGPSTVPVEMPPPHPVFAPLEADLRRRVEQSVPGGLEVQMAWALRLTVMAQVERDHEQTYRLIFGSQIAALKELNVRGPLTIDQSREVFAVTAMKNYPDTFKAETFGDWAEFLVNRNLVVVAPQPFTNETRAILTPLGKDFLMFVTSRGLTEYKWG